MTSYEKIVQRLKDDNGYFEIFDHNMRRMVNISYKDTNTGYKYIKINIVNNGMSSQFEIHDPRTVYVNMAITTILLEENVVCFLFDAIEVFIYTIQNDNRNHIQESLNG